MDLDTSFSTDLLIPKRRQGLFQTIEFCLAFFIRRFIPNSQNYPISFPAFSPQ